MAARIFLILTGIVFAGFGLWGLIEPAAMLKRFDIVLAAPEARTAIRAMYGGFCLGAGALFLSAAFSAAYRRAGLWAVVILSGVILATRLIGMALDGSGGAYHLSYAALESIGLIAGVILLLQKPKRI